MDLKGKTIIVAGGKGFIGMHLVERLLEEEPKKIIVVDKCVHEWQNKPQERYKSNVIFYRFPVQHVIGAVLLEFEPVDIVFNLAVNSLPHSLRFPYENFQDNVQIVQILIENLRKGMYRRLIHFSSSEVYGSAKYSPMSEDHPCEPSTPYAASKIACDYLIQSYCKVFGVDARILRPFNTYGPGQNDSTYAGVIPATIKRLMAGKPPVVFGGGYQTRDYTYVSDVVDAAVRLCQYGKTDIRGDIFNVASGVETSVNEIIGMIVWAYYEITKAEVLSTQKEPARPGDVMRHIGCAYRLEELIGFKPSVPFDVGLWKTVNWYITKGREDKQ